MKQKQKFQKKKSPTFRLTLIFYFFYFLGSWEWIVLTKHYCHLSSTSSLLSPTVTDARLKKYVRAFVALSTRRVSFFDT